MADENATQADESITQADGADKVGTDAHDGNGKAADVGTEPQAKYTDKDVDEIIERRFAKWQKQQDAKVEEAKRLGEMNAQEKLTYERDQLQGKLDELERANAVSGMLSESRRQLRERSIDVPDELVGMLVGETAEDTKAAVDAFADSFDAAVEAGVKARLAGTAPKGGVSQKPVTRADIDAIKDTAERQAAIKKHQDLYR
jgi:sugar-specific transcriptional regulator TrmB